MHEFVGSLPQKDEWRRTLAGSFLPARRQAPEAAFSEAAYAGHRAQGKGFVGVAGMGLDRARAG